MTKEEIIKFVREGLSALGSYSPAFEILIEGMAEVAMVRAKAFDLLQRDGIIQEEESREGAIRRRYHPAWSVFIEANKPH